MAALFAGCDLVGDKKKVKRMKKKVNRALTKVFAPGRQALEAKCPFHYDGPEVDVSPLRGDVAPAVQGAYWFFSCATDRLHGHLQTLQRSAFEACGVCFRNYIDDVGRLGIIPEEYADCKSTGWSEDPGKFQYF